MSAMTEDGARLAAAIVAAGGAHSFAVWVLTPPNRRIQ